MKNNLVLFTNNFPYKRGETFLETEIHYLANAHDEIHIIPLNHGEEYAMALPTNVKVLDFKFQSPVSLRKTLRRHWPVIIKWYFSEFIRSPHRFKYISQFKWNLYGFAGLVDCADRLKKIVISYPEKTMYYSYWFNEWGSTLSILKNMMHDFHFITRVHLYDFEEEFYQRGYIPFRYGEIEQPDKIVAISQYGLNYLNYKWPAQKNKYLLSRLGVNSGGLNPAKSEGDPMVIVSCSNLSPYKRPLLLAKVMKEIEATIEWHHFGDGDLRNEFLAETRLLPENVKFYFHGYLPNHEVIEFYNTKPVTAVLNVSKYEGIPVSLMEAISCGIPIIGCNICGIPELVKDQTGLLLEVEDSAETMAEKIEKFIESKCLDSAFREGVLKFWAENYNANANYPNFIKNVLTN